MRYIIIAALCMVVWSGGWGENGYDWGWPEEFPETLNIPKMPQVTWDKPLPIIADSIREYPEYLSIPTDTWLMVEIMRIVPDTFMTIYSKDSVLDGVDSKKKWIYGWTPTYYPIPDTIIDTVWIRGTR